MYNVLKLNSISSLVNDVFDENYALSNLCEEPDLILVRSAAMADYAAPENLLAVGRAGAGVNNIPFADYVKKGIVVFNTPGANANAVKELVLSALLLSCRKIYEGINWAKTLQGKGDEVKGLVEKGKSQFVGGEILGKTLGIIGMGAIGRLVADSAAALRMNVIGYDPYLSKDAITNPAITLVDTMEEIYAKADFISIHVPFTASTKGFINKETIAQMKDNVVIINAARGELVNNADIIEAVHSGKVAKYFTDFPVEEVLNVENIIPCPHLGASTPEAEDNCAVMVAQELRDYVENGNVKNSVNFPALRAERNGFRLTVLCNANADTFAAVNQIITDAKLSMTAINSAVKGEAQYIIVDTADKVSDETVATIKNIDGVYRVRTID